MQPQALKHLEGPATRVMVVDGSKLVRKLIADVLQRDLPGVEVIGCDSIEDAQLALAQGPVDLVTTSLTLRDGDGLALARMVREAAGQAYVPVIVVSGDAQQHLEQRRFTEYVTDYFDKALGHEALATFIRGYVQPQTIPGATILYIEDSRVVAEATKRMLERQQLNVLHVVSAEEAFTLLTAESLGRSRHRIDLVLTDVILKGELILVEEKSALMKKLGKKTLTLNLIEPLGALPADLSEWDLTLKNEGGELEYSFDANADDTGVPSLIRRLEALNIGFKDLNTRQSSLEDIFVSLVHQNGAAA